MSLPCRLALDSVHFSAHMAYNSVWSFHPSLALRRVPDRLVLLEEGDGWVLCICPGLLVSLEYHGGVGFDHSRPSWTLCGLHGYANLPRAGAPPQRIPIEGAHESAL